jgi:hypothetical protein
VRIGEWRYSADILNNNITADTNYIQVRIADKAGDMGNFVAIGDSSDNVASSLQHVIVLPGLFKKYSDWNCSGCSLGGMCLQLVLTLGEVCSCRRKLC